MTQVTPQCMHCIYCGMPKDTCLAEATSNSEEIKLAALATIKLHFSEDISQAVNQSVENSSFKIL